MRSAPDFTLKQLAYFRALVNTDSFGAAATATNISQPALSLQIQTLEDHFGGQLIERRRGGLKIAPLGTAVLEYAQDILNRAEELSTLKVQARDAPRDPVRLGLIPTVAPYLLPHILPDLRDTFPDVPLTIREGQTQTLIQDLESNAIDAAIMAVPTEPAWLDTARLFEEPFVLAAGPGFSPPKTRTVPISALKTEEILLLEEGHCLRDQTIQACGINVNRAINQFGATSLATIIEMVASGYGVTLLPEMALDKEAVDPRIRLFRLKAPCPTRELGLVWRMSSPYGDFYREMAASIQPPTKR